MTTRNAQHAQSSSQSKRQHKVYQVSQDAREHLYKLARRANYCHDMGVNQRGISDYIIALTSPTVTFEDTRPDYLQEVDTERVTTYNKLPIWYDPEPTRYDFGINIDPKTQAALYNIALRFGITNFKRPNTLSHGTVISALLEAIGQQCLTPNNVPMAPPKKYSYRKIKRSDPTENWLPFNRG